MPTKPHFNDLYKRRIDELLGADSKDLDRIEEEFNRKWTPEEWFQNIKKRWYFHELSGYMFSETQSYFIHPDERIPIEQVDKIDTHKFCTPPRGNKYGCVDGCPYCAEEGKLEYSTIQQGIESLNHFPHIQDARKILEEEREKARRGTRTTDLTKINKNVDDPFAIPTATPITTDLTAEGKHPLFKLLKGQVFWIWDHRHLHLQEFLKTQGRCCFNHCIGEPKKWNALMPIW